MLPIPIRTVIDDSEDSTRPTNCRILDGEVHDAALIRTVRENDIYRFLKGLESNLHASIGSHILNCGGRGIEHGRKGENAAMRGNIYVNHY